MDTSIFYRKGFNAKVVENTEETHGRAVVPLCENALGRHSERSEESLFAF